jgi:hypothetical protein
MPSCCDSATSSEELAEVLAVDFGDEEGMPKLNPNWRWGDQEQALLSSCSSLIAIVESDGITDCAILALLGQRVPDLGSARYLEWRHLALSYRS